MAKRSKSTSKPRKKKASKKKAAKKKPARKKTAKKASKKAASKKKHTLVKTDNADDPHPDNLQTQIAVWDAYARRPSIRHVVEITGFSDWIVRKVLNMDRPRLLQMHRDAMEAVVAGWEEKASRAHRLADELLRQFETMLMEINRAAEAGQRTNIRGPDGFLLSVPDAREMLVMSRMLAQVMEIAKQGQTISDSFRMGVERGDDEAHSTEKTFAQMDDAELAKVIEAGGYKVSAPLREKAKRIAEQARK